MSDAPLLANFDPQYCGRVVKISAAICAALLACTLAIVLIVDPSTTRCPGWLVVTARNGVDGYLYGFIAMQAAAASWICFIAIRWRWFAATVINKLQWAKSNLASRTEGGIQGEYDRFQAMCAVLLDHNHLFVVVNIGWAAFCSIPVVLLALRCA